MRNFKTILSTALLTITVATSAFAQTAAPSGEGAPGHHHRGFGRARMMERLDRNQNGRIEVAELPPRLAERLAAADANRDGVLAPEEMRAHFEARRAERRAQMDTDHDGAISPEERTAAREARQAARFARLDANGDGAATADEVGERRWTFISRADANGDGRVTRDELQTIRRGGRFHHRGWHRGPQGNGGPQG